LNFPLFNTNDSQNHITVEAVNAQNVFIIDKNLTLYFTCPANAFSSKCNGFIELNEGNNHHKKKVPKNVSVEEK
jgi:hypothetical protein